MKIDDKIISNATVRLIDPQTTNCIGSGIIYNSDHLGESLYVLTAAHSLFRDGDEFTNPYKEVVVDFYDSEKDVYQGFNKQIDFRLVSKDKDKDAAVIVFRYDEIQGFAGKIEKVICVEERHSYTDFVVKGFPNATQGKELDVIKPIWKQQMTGVRKFQLKLEEDYNSWAVQGFSGSGVFLSTGSELYLYGIFTRYREKSVGKVIYCQYLDVFNELLEKCFMKPLVFSYTGEQGMSPDFFQQKTDKAIADLGPRFSKKLNFRLPIALKFSDLSKDTLFKARIFRIFDNWITEKNYRRLLENEHIGETEKGFDELREKVKDWLNEIDFKAGEQLDFAWMFEEVNSFYELASSKIDHLYKLRREAEKELKKEGKKYDSYHAPYYDEIERLWKIVRHNRDFLEELENDVDVDLANRPFLIIKGEAGCGKSHLLGDIATQKQKEKVPSILLLGQHFSNLKSISVNILEQLDLQCSFKDFLRSLNGIGQQINCRVLIMIDALNESKTPDLWKEGLAGFIQELSGYPFIGLALTVRSTYFKSVIPDNIRDNNSITFITHEGFRGNEYDALSMFCDFYGLRQPTFPILAPEFTNPLFLQLVCMGVQNSAEKSFPLGFQGIKKVFDFYIDALNSLLLAKTEYAHRKDLVMNAIKRVASKCFEQDLRMLPLEEAVTLFDNEFGRFPNLLYDLIQENVLIKNMSYDYDNDKEYEAVYFAYERFGDFYIADEVLKSYEGAEELIKAFEKDEPLARLIYDYHFEGIIEAFSVLLPEEFGIEIYEVFDWLIKEEKDIENYPQKTFEIGSYFLRSLTWRSVGSIDNDKMDKWLSGNDFKSSIDSWICKLFELTAIPGHPLNSDCLHTGLRKYSMADRDSFWQSHLLNYGDTDEYESALPIKRLIDWAWTRDISLKIDYETARLTAQSLAWILASTNIVLRDRTTKAMVNLLENQPEAMISTLKAFRRTNDSYILERLFAVAYGCVLRSKKKTAVFLISDYVYKSIFKNGRPPKNILLRDYARNICEFAMYKNSNIKYNTILIRPPYKSELPNFPEKEEISAYKIEYNEQNAKISNRHAYNRIYESTLKGDFGYKIVDPVMHEFSPLELGMDAKIKQFVRSLTKYEKTLFGIVSANLELLHLLRNTDLRSSPIFSTEQELNAEIEKTEKHQQETLQDFKAENRIWIENNAIPQLELKWEAEDRKGLFFSSNQVKNWIVKRAFNLGYDKDLHGDFDSGTGKYISAYNKKVERIGKKYQWIAYYEILGIIADNFEMQREWGSKKVKLYKGAWELYLRNIDPAYTARNSYDEEFDDELGIKLKLKDWWSEPEYLHWNIPSKEWAAGLDDIPRAKDIILKTDTEGIQWVHLQHYVSWREPKKLGEDKYLSPNKRFWLEVQGYLVKKADKKKIISYLSDRNVTNRMIPENGEAYGRLINREKFWSPAYFDQEVDIKWEYINTTEYKVIVTTTTAKGSMELDKSGANAAYNIPCQTLFDGLQLEYSSNDGDFNNSQGELIVTNVNPEGVLVRKDILEEFLVQNKLEIFWLIRGEKISDSGDRSYHFGIPCGVFHIERGILKGEMKMYKRD